MLDLGLAIAHHLAVFALVGVFFAEFVLLRPGVAGARLRQLGRLDGAYGALAGLVIVIGILRVLFGTAGWEFYVGNWAFWLKMAAFLVVGLISVPPTLRILAWNRSLKADPDFAPVDAEVARMRRLLHIEAAVLLLIPVFAAMIPRIYGI